LIAWALSFALGAGLAVMFVGVAAVIGSWLLGEQRTAPAPAAE
jgi:hypothetical protein